MPELGSLGSVRRAFSNERPYREDIGRCRKDCTASVAYYERDPNAAGVLGDNLRELTAVHPYIIHYEVIGDELTTRRVRHSWRRPTERR